MELITNKDLKKLHSEFKDVIGILNKRTPKVSEKTKTAIKKIVYSLDSNNRTGYETLKFYIYKIPQQFKNNQNEDLYVSILNIIAERINEKDFLTFFCGTDKFDYTSIFTLISELDNICLKTIDTNSIVKIFEDSKSYYKIRSTLILLTDYDLDKDSVLVNNLINTLSNTENEDKLKSIHTIIVNLRPKTYKKDNNIIDGLINYIKIEKDNTYDKNVNLIINKLIEKRRIDKIDYLNNNIIELIFETNLENYNNKNMKVLIELLNDEFVLTDNWDIRDKIVETTLQMKFLNDKHKDVYSQVISNIILPSDYTDSYFKQCTLDTICNLKSSKTLEILLDIYPFINKYNNNDEKREIINTISSEEPKVKRLVIPIHN